MRVVKVGGGVLTGPAQVGMLPQVLPPGPCVVVISALGKTTDALQRVAQAAMDGERQRAHELLEDLLHWHWEVAAGLGVEPAGAGLTWWASRARDLVHLPHGAPEEFTDAVVSVGEHLASRIVAGFLRACGLPVGFLDSTRVIVTDTRFGGARVRWSLTRRAVRAAFRSVAPITVMAGFIASTSDGRPSTLGREGSDYTAALVGAVLGAQEVVLLKQVAGVMTADPEVIPEARTIPFVSYHQAFRLFRQGAKVVHPKSVLPLSSGRIPLRVGRFLGPDSGSLIGPGVSWEAGRIHAIVTRPLGEGLFRIAVVGEPPLGAVADQVKHLARAAGARVRLAAPRWGLWVAQGPAEAARALHTLVERGGATT